MKQFLVLRDIQYDIVSGIKSPVRPIQGDAESDECDVYWKQTLCKIYI